MQIYDFILNNVIEKKNSSRKSLKEKYFNEFGTTAGFASLKKCIAALKKCNAEIDRAPSGIYKNTKHPQGKSMLDFYSDSFNKDASKYVPFDDWKQAFCAYFKRGSTITNIKAFCDKHNFITGLIEINNVKTSAIFGVYLKRSNYD
jgi:hypothetical protein